MARRVQELVNARFRIKYESIKYFINSLFSVQTCIVYIVYVYADIELLSVVTVKYLTLIIPNKKLNKRSLSYFKFIS